MVHLSGGIETGRGKEGADNSLDKEETGMKKYLGPVLVFFIFVLCMYGIYSYSQEIQTGSELSEEDLAELKAYFMPPFNFDINKVPPAPDYRELDTWAALPFRKDHADLTPPNTAFAEAQADAGVDVFYVHSTGYISRDSWNAPWDDPGAAEETSGEMKYCAGVFNGASKVYALRYRQATLYSFFDNETTSGIRALDLAYSDVKSAFRHYITNWNQGRPFILAGHSQGSFHSMHLLQEEIIGTELEDRLVAAYLIGYSVPEQIPGIKPSRSAIDTGTVIGWNSYTKDANTDFFTQFAVIWLNGSYQKIGGRSIVEINPLSWELHGGEVPAGKNLGSLPISVPNSPGKLADLVPGVTGADASGEVLIIDKPKISGFPGLGPDMPLLNSDFGNYHNYDYQLFYENIRRNVIDRVKSFELQNLEEQNPERR